LRAEDKELQVQTISAAVPEYPHGCYNTFNNERRLVSRKTLRQFRVAGQQAWAAARIALHQPGIVEREQSGYCSSFVITRPIGKPLSKKDGAD
jgi:hypothetical protein